MKKILNIGIIFFMCSCVNDDIEPIVLNPQSRLSTDIEGRFHQLDAVVACAAGDSLNSDLIRVYYYPEEGAQNVKFYETNSPDVDPNDFFNYLSLDIEDAPFFGGTLRQFERLFSSEQYIIVTYEVNDSIKISTPIRTKNNSLPTEWINTIEIDQQQSTMPLFNWNVASEENNAIFFEVVSDSNDDFLSGTYTYDSEFQYYNLSNVVFNITNGTPPDLIVGNDYAITVMDVSIDNWVNQVINSPFTAE